ncbi:MAG: acetoacetate decarboxylase family protein [Candidatus Pacebacteria bacterium]|nr:acetoacetate decarboxylase family protein [Candidatus Paceibacterota bacterium]
MTSNKGFFYPRSGSGESSLLPAPPWHYSGDLLTIEYRTDPSLVAELLPPPLKLAKDDPGAVALIWADWQSCGASHDEMLDPIRSQYKEAFVVVRCDYQGATYSRCVYIWVDKDFAMLRGIHQGYPKKMGSIHMTRPHPFAPAPRLEAGARFGATLAAGDRRLSEAVIRLTKTTDKNGFVNGHPMAHHRFYPAIQTSSTQPDSGDVFAELIESTAAKFEGGPVWQGEVEQFSLFDSPTEELTRLMPREMIGAFYRQIGVVWNGGKSLEIIEP